MDTTPATTRGSTAGRATAGPVVLVLLLAGCDVLSGPRPGPDKVRASKATLHMIRGALEMLKGEQGRYPDQLADLVPGFYARENPLKDAWRHDFVYSPAASADHPFVLLSNGRDGLPGTKDDLDPWTDI